MEWRKHTRKWGENERENRQSNLVFPSIVLCWVLLAFSLRCKVKKIPKTGGIQTKLRKRKGWKPRNFFFLPRVRLTPHTLCNRLNLLFKWVLSLTKLDGAFFPCSTKGERILLHIITTNFKAQIKQIFQQEGQLYPHTISDVASK